LTPNTFAFTTNDSKGRVSHYLKLAGKIDLEKISIGTNCSDLNPTSSSFIRKRSNGDKE
jgi:hypothetical protein